MILQPRTSRPGAALRAWATSLITVIAGCTPPLATPPAMAPPPPLYPPISSIHVTCPHIPAPPAAKPPPAAGSSQVLQPGHWDWSDGAYVLTPPHWEPEASAQARHWKNGYWEVNGGACVWHDGSFTPATL